MHGFKSVVNAAINVTDNSKLYAFGNYAESKGNQSFNYRAPVSSTAVDTNGVVRNQGANGAFNNTFFLTPCPTGNATCPAGGFVRDTNTFRFANLYPAGFTPRFVGKSQEIYGVVGYRDERRLQLRLVGHLGAKQAGAVDVQLGQLLLRSATQTSFDFGDLIQKEVNANADFTYAADLGLAAPLTISFGGEFRKETYEQTAGDEQSYAAGPYAVAQRLYTQTAPGVYAFSGTTAAQGVGASGYAAPARRQRASSARKPMACTSGSRPI
jgi:iron complex outermembrane receptor protein